MIKLKKDVSAVKTRACFKTIKNNLVGTCSVMSRSFTKTCGCRCITL